jgi:hypothetical protein
MEAEVISVRISSILALFDMQTTFFSSALAGISDTDAHNRLHTKANHIAWLAGSLVQERFETAKALGENRRQAAHELFQDNKGIQDNITYPSLNSYAKDWKMITPVLRSALVNVSDEKLDAQFEMAPGMTMTYFELIAFIIYREANIIGQIALWRRLLGYEAMKYM